MHIIYANHVGEVVLHPFDIAIGDRAVTVAKTIGASVRIAIGDGQETRHLFLPNMAKLIGFIDSSQLADFLDASLRHRPIRISLD